MKIAAIQHDIVWEDPEANFARLAPMVAAASTAGANMVVLAEMFSTGFSMDPERIAEPRDGASTRFLTDQAIEHRVWVCGSLPERPHGQDRPFNRLILAAPDGTVHRYAKIHPFTYAHEDEHYAAGKEHLTVDVEGMRVTPFVCYDLRFGNEFWSVAPDTDLYVVVANWPESRRTHWRTLLRARAIENQAYVIGVNRVGRGGKLDYSGDSRIIDPTGEILAEAARTEAILTAEVTPRLVGETRERYPFLGDRRAGV